LIGKEEEDWQERYAVPVLVIKPGEEDKFAKKVMTFDQQFFDQPAAARYLTGMIHTINQYSLREAGAVTINDAAEKISIFLNCDDKEVSDEISSNSKFDKLQIIAQKNILNSIYPLRTEFSWMRLLGIIYGIQPRIKHWVDKYDFRD
jgi:hypothetical protein